MTIDWQQRAVDLSGGYQQSLGNQLNQQNLAYDASLDAQISRQSISRLLEMRQQIDARLYATYNEAKNAIAIIEAKAKAQPEGTNAPGTNTAYSHYDHKAASINRTVLDERVRKLTERVRLYFKDCKCEISGQSVLDAVNLVDELYT